MSTIYSILAKFAPRAARTSTAPNSWAVVALWRRVFTLKEEEYDETVEILQECLEDDKNKNHGGPITSPFAVEARQDFLRSIALRNNNNNSNHNTIDFNHRRGPAPTAATATPQQQQQQHGGSLSTLTRQERNAIHERSLNEPNLHVQLGHIDAMYLPQ